MNEKTKLFDERTEDLFNKLVRLHKWDEQRRGAQADREQAPAALAGGGQEQGVQPPPPRILQVLAELSRHEPEFRRAVKELEALASPSDEQKPGAAPPPPVSLLPPGVWGRICNAVTQAKPLRALFASEPRFSEADPRALATLVQLADVTPDERLQLATQDGVMTLMLQRNLSDGKLPEADAMLVEYLKRILDLYLTDEPLTARLAVLADKPYWQAVLSSLEDDEDHTEETDSAARQALRQWTAGLKPEERASLKLKLETPPRLSQTPPELFALVWARRSDLEETKQQATTQVSQSPSASQQAGVYVTAQTDVKRWTVAVRESLSAPGPATGALSEVEYALRLREEVAAHLIEVRKIAKVEALRYRWPAAALLALRNRESIVELEDYLRERRLTAQSTEPAFTSDEARDLYKLSEQDRQFTRFLRLRPHFKDIPFFQYLSASPLPLTVATTGSQLPTTQVQQAVTQARPPATPSGSQTASQEATPRGTVRADRSAPVPRQDSGPAATEARPSDADTAAAQTPRADYETVVFKINLEKGRAPNSLNYTTAVKFANLGEIAARPEGSLLDVMEAVYKKIGVPAGQQSMPFLSRMFAREDTEYLFKLGRAGEALFRGLFDESALPRITEELKEAPPDRLVIETSDPAVAEMLPWEWLSLPGEGEPFIMSQSHSLVRAFPRREPVPEKKLSPPLRVLIVAPSYAESTRDEVKKRAQMLSELVAPHSTGALLPAATKILSGDEVYEERLREVVSDFIPHVIHFEGRVGGRLNPTDENDTSNLFLSLSSIANGPEQPLSLPQFEEMLEAELVRLVLIEPGPFCTLYPLEALSFCTGLMGGVLPAAVMPVREVSDRTLLEFLGEFYGGLLNGLLIEAAVANARLRLVGRGGDWTAFALFSDPETLDRGRIIPAPPLSPPL